MNKQLDSRGSMKTNYELCTRLKGMDSNVMQFVILDSLGLFTLGIKRHQENGPVRDFLHYTQEFYECLISLKQNFTSVGLTICTYLRNLLGQHMFMNRRYKSQVLHEKVAMVFQVVSYRRRKRHQMKYVQ